MAIGDAELNEIRERNAKRKELKNSASEGPWTYDSWAFINYSEKIPRKRRMAILIRPEEWFVKLGNRIDEGIVEYKSLVQQGYDDALFIIDSRSGRAEADIDALLEEIDRLQKSK